MIGLGIALMVIGIVFGFVIPWVGILVGLVGLALFIFFVGGYGRRPALLDSRPACVFPC
jgi:hypothetical protein